MKQLQLPMCDGEMAFTDPIVVVAIIIVIIICRAPEVGLPFVLHTLTLS